MDTNVSEINPHFIEFQTHLSLSNSQMIEKREQFSVSLRREKKSKILAMKR